MAVRIETRAEPIPGYRLIDRIGGGGFGEVWRAEAPGGLHKAIKFVFGDLSSAGDNGQRAEQELKALKRVQSVRHPYILTLERYDIIDGQLMIVMELADRNLWDRFKECRAQGMPGIPRDELLGYLEEAAEALDLMNREYQLQHLDIKPQNLFLVHNHVKVADFGLVKDLENSQASITGGITPVYAAPETFDGKVTRYSDQYSLAIVYQELLTGQRPFTGNSVRQLILQHLQGVPNVAPLPLTDQPHIARALAKQPNERFPTCRELLTQLRNATGEALPASPSRQALLNAPLTSGPQSIPSTDQGMATANIRCAVADTPASQATQNIRQADPSVLRGDLDAARAPQEATGNGALLPTLVIGLGQMGLLALQQTREIIASTTCPLTQLPNIRFLLLDTDPEVLRTAPACHPSAGLSPANVLIAPLNRPSHYIKPRDGKPALETWLNPRLLYRIPRSQVTTGVRALGRLAFMDNYRSIMRRLQLELDSILDPDALPAAVRMSRLGLRTNRPRVYIVTALSGGSGSGMFLDLAYNVRALLRQMGYENPDVVGLLLLPPVDGNRTRVLPLGNTYAALTELNHFASPQSVFRTRYHDRETPVEDPEPPFGRTVLMPLPDETDEVATREVMQLCGQVLSREMTSQFGKSADLGRAGMPAPPWERRGQFGQTFGLAQLCWPRHALVRAVARELCRRLTQRWLSKDSKPIREQVSEWVQQQWTYLELGADTFIHRIQTELIRSQGRPMDAVFAEAIAAGEFSAQGEPPSARGRSKTEPRRLTREQVAAALAGLEELVGVPEEDTPAEPPRLARLIREATDRIAAEWCQKLMELPVRLIEEPIFRLAGAEESVRLLVTNLEQVLQHHEPLARDLAEKAQDAYDHLRIAAGGQARAGSKILPKTADQLVALCKLYPKHRYQYLILSHLSASFVGLRGHLSDELREINFCRVRLTELLRLLDDTPQGEALPTKSSLSKQGTIGRMMFVSGCQDLAEAAKQFLDAIAPEELLELDGRMAEMFRGNFTALVHVCLTNQNLLRQVEKAMLDTASDFVSERLPATSVAKLFLEQHTDAEEAAQEAEDLYQQAAPELPVSRTARSMPSEMCVLAAPADANSDQFREVLKESLPEIEFHASGSTDDILIYRERLNVALTDLEHLGSVGHDAYTQLSSAEHFTPHARCDIDFRP